MLAMMVVVPSCKDDDDPKDNPANPDDPTEEGDEPVNTALKYWDVVGQLVGIDQYTDNYQNATFEPIIGTGEGNTRYIATNDMATAAQNFADLVGVSIDENTATYKFEDPEIGTLTYTKVGDGSTLATVDVSIKQIPHLDKIVYRTGNDDNGKFGDQKSWYRFGDIVKRTVNGKDEYWICVRPAFTYEGKEDSHWVCVNEISEPDNVFHHSGSNGKEYYVPKNLGKDFKHMRNFAEMLYAICYPQEWFDYCIANGSNGMPIFGDFKVSNISYHNQYFWQNVQEAWSSIPEVTTALNCSIGEIVDFIKNDGVTLLYSGYSWWTSTSWNLSLYQVNFSNGTTAKQKNMHKEDDQTIKKNVKGFSHDFDCRKMGNAINNYKEFFGDNKIRWAIRHATGEQLNGGNDLPATSEIQGVTEVYRYYSHYPMEKARKGKDDSNGPEVSVATLDNNTVVEGYFVSGDVIKTSDGSRWICIAGSPSALLGDITDHKAYFISLDNVTTGPNSNIISTQEDAMMTAYRLCSFLTTLEDMKSVENRFVYGKELGNILKKVKEVSGVDMSKMFLQRDSTWTFMNGVDAVPSKSSNYFFNIAYGSNGDIMRYVMDVTRAGDGRSKAPAGFKPDWFHWFYTKYQNYDESQIRELTDVEKTTFLMKKWNLTWPMSSKAMNIADVSSLAQVTSFAKQDKWVTLPETGTTGRAPYRASTSNYQAADYVYQQGQDFKTNMYNEPVLLMRLMKLEDDGSGTQTAPDGTPIEVLYHISDKSYKSILNTLWIGSYISHVDEEVPEVFLNNVPYNLPAFPTKH